MKKYNHISEKINQDGVYYKKKWLNNVMVKKLKKILLSSEALEKANKNGIFSNTNKQLFRDLISLKLNRFKNSIHLLNLSKNLELEKIADEIFNEKSQLIVIDGYISKVSSETILDWHQDQAFSGKKTLNENELRHPDSGFIKFFFFLTEVKYNNGSLAYIPKSNTVSKAYKKALYEKKIIYQPFWELKDFREELLKNREIILKYIPEASLNEFLNNSNFIEEKKDTNMYDKNLMPGDAIIFDEHGVHRASKPSINDRYILRFVYKRKRFL